MGNVVRCETGVKPGNYVIAHTVWCVYCVCRMEETVRSLLQNQGVLEQTAVDTVDIMKAYKVNYILMLIVFINL